MKCEEFRNLIWNYLENEVTEDVAQEMEVHVQKCLQCKEEMEETKKVMQALESLSQKDLPEGYHIDLMGRLAEETKVIPLKSSKKPQYKWKQFSLIAAAAVLVVAVGGGQELLDLKNTMNLDAATARIETAETENSGLEISEDSGNNGVEDISKSAIEYEDSQENPNPSIDIFEDELTDTTKISQKDSSSSKTDSQDNDGIGVQSISNEEQPQNLEISQEPQGLLSEEKPSTLGIAEEPQLPTPERVATQIAPQKSEVENVASQLKDTIPQEPRNQTAERASGTDDTEIVFDSTIHIKVENSQEALEKVEELAQTFQAVEVEVKSDNIATLWLPVENNEAFLVEIENLGEVEQLIPLESALEEKDMLLLQIIIETK